MRAAQNSGKHVGRPRLLTFEVASVVGQRIYDGELDLRKAADELGVSPITVCRAIARCEPRCGITRLILIVFFSYLLNLSLYFINLFIT